MERHSDVLYSTVYNYWAKYYNVVFCNVILQQSQINFPPLEK